MTEVGVQLERFIDSIDFNYCDYGDLSSYLSDLWLFESQGDVSLPMCLTPPNDLEEWMLEGELLEGGEILCESWFMDEM